MAQWSARWAHNSEVGGSTPLLANFFVFFNIYTLNIFSIFNLESNILIRKIIFLI